MKLYLVRHGVAIDRIGGEIRNDFERPLTAEGREESEKVAMILKRLGVKPDLLLSSPLVRARQTAECFLKVFALDKDKLSIADGLAPAGNLSSVYELAGKHKKANEICFFGHDPDIMYLAQALLWTQPDLNMPFKKAGVARIDVASLPPTQPGALRWFFSPKFTRLL